MAKLLNPLMVEKYDIANKILKELADLESRHVLFSIIKKPKTAQEIALSLKIPISTVYKKIQDLLEISLLAEEKKFSGSGRIIRYYQSKISYAEISIKKFEPSITLNKNTWLKK